MSVTFVTAFVDLNRVESRPQVKSREEYLREGRKLLESGVPLVLFAERSCVPELFREHAPPPHVDVVPFEFADLWARSWMEGRSGLRLPAIRSVKKDTFAYMAVQHQKTDWIRQASLRNPFKTDSFAWIDFGFAWMMDSEVSALHAELRRISQYSIPSSRIIAPGLVHPASLLALHHILYLVEYPYFSFLGTFLAVGAQAALRFDDLHKQVARELFSRSGVITWEVVAWIALYAEAPELFEHYVADHDDSLLKNFPDILEPDPRWGEAS